MLIQIPEFSLVVLIGCAGSGKTTFAHSVFSEDTLVSSGDCRRMISLSDHDPQASHDTFELMHTIIGMRLKRRLRTVVDACHLSSDSRRPLVELARKYHARLVAIVFDLPFELCLENLKRGRTEALDEETLQRQYKSLQSQKRGLNHEGFHEIYTLSSLQDIKQTYLRTLKPPFDQRESKGPFDIIGDIHGCADELIELLQKLGYAVHASKGGTPQISHPQGRQLIFVGDLVDRGPAVVKVLQIVMQAVKSRAAYCVVGNHENKLLRYLAGRRVKITHGLERTIDQLEMESRHFRDELYTFLGQLSDHLIFDDERLVVVHAGIKEEFIGRNSGEIRAFCMYGETSSELDEFGLPMRLPWAKNYFGDALIVYGHTPVSSPHWTHNSINIDTGCVYGGSLSALRYPERELVSVPAHRVHYEPRRPIATISDEAPRLRSLPIPRKVSDSSEGG